MLVGTGTINAETELYTLLELRIFNSWIVAYIDPEYPIPATPAR